MVTRISVFTCCALLLNFTAFTDFLTAQEKEKQAAKVKKVVVAQTQATKLAIVQRATAVKLAEVQKVISAATKALAEAEKVAAATQDEAAKQVAIKRVEKARQKLEKARKAAVKQLAVLKKYVEKLRIVLKLESQQLLVLQGSRGGGFGFVPENIDPENPIERFLLLAPGGPIVVEVAITLDGKPFRIAREKLIDEMLAFADKDKTGKITWEDAIQDPFFTAGRFRVTNKTQRDRYIKNFDINKNGLVDRAEVRRFLAKNFGGAAFTINNSSGYNTNFAFQGSGRLIRGGGQADLKQLLDTDKNNQLSIEEIAVAADRLKSRDADDNDLLELSELSGNTNTNIYTRQRILSRQQSQMSVLLGPSAQAKQLFQALHQQYKNDKGQIVSNSFSTMPKLFAQVDRNKNGRLELNEVLEFNKIDPHIRLAANFGKTDEMQGFTLVALAPEFHKSKETNSEILLELPGLRLMLSANLSPPRTTNYERIAKSNITRYDKDKNGYLEKKELAANIARQFEKWDINRDGKVFGKEITTFFNRQQAPRNTQIRASIAKRGNVLFQALDVDGDGRLGLREMKTSPQRLRTFDKNKDGKIGMDEIPVTISVSLAPTRAGNNALPQRWGTRATVNRPKTNAPKWFTRMDRNGDGDVTLKEFLGTKAEFEKLDTNSDGFIEAKEAAK